MIRQAQAMFTPNMRTFMHSYTHTHMHKSDTHSFFAEKLRRCSHTNMRSYMYTCTKVVPVPYVASQKKPNHVHIQDVRMYALAHTYMHKSETHIMLLCRQPQTMFTPNVNALTKDDSKPSAAKILSALRARHASAESASSSRIPRTPINHVREHHDDEPGPSSAGQTHRSAPVFMTPAAITPSDVIRSASPRQHTPPFHVKDNVTSMSVSTVRADTDEIMRSAGVFGTPAVGSPIPPARNTSDDIIEPTMFAKEVNVAAVKFGPAYEFETPGTGSPTNQDQQVASSPWVVHEALTVNQ
jgi:hypothetical protein